MVESEISSESLMSTVPAGLSIQGIAFGFELVLDLGAGAGTPNSKRFSLEMDGFCGRCRALAAPCIPHTFPDARGKQTKISKTRLMPRVPLGK
mmetsp:Transcript_41443/g.84734  ORF Transcript_41443/g.84734 Transcript_41443/m.84734 type:complete len:93 (-) Transcript_41443:109-387(-)